MEIKGHYCYLSNNVITTFCAKLFKYGLVHMISVEIVDLNCITTRDGPCANKAWESFKSVLYGVKRC